MKNKILAGAIILAGITSGLMVAHGQTIQTQIQKIDVDFVRNVALITFGTGYYNQETNTTTNTVQNVWIPSGTTSTTEIDEPAFDQMVNALSQSNALNLNAVEQQIINSI